MHTRQLNLLMTMMLLGAILVVWARTAGATLNHIEDALELTRDRIVVRDSGRLRVRPCASCAWTSLTVDAGTEFLLDRPGKTGLERVSIETWRDAERRSDPGDTLIYVYFRTADRGITRIVLDRND